MLVLTDMSPPKYKKELQVLLAILNYLSKFLQATAEVCEPWGKLASVKADWIWNKMYQDLYDRAKIGNQERHMYEIL